MSQLEAGVVKLAERIAQDKTLRRPDIDELHVTKIAQVITDFLASHTAQESRGEEEVFRFEGYIDKYEDEDAYFVQPSTHEQEGIFANLYHAGSPNFTIVILNPPVPQTVNVEEEGSHV